MYSAFGNMMGDLIARSLNNAEEGDYTDSEGFLVCGKCHTRKQFEVILPFAGQGKKTLVGIPCACREKELAAEEAAAKMREHNRRLEMLRRDGIADPAYLRYTFDRDDGRNPDKTAVCRKYADRWPDMKAGNIGILFFGGVGTGKSFFACCIANALIDRLIPACVTSFPQILNALQGNFDRDRRELLDRLQQASLLVIDDLGAERDTSYSLEQVYGVVDARLRSGKPLIVTTNLSIEELKKPRDLQYQRIYDRVLEMCPIWLKLAGGSRRTGNAEQRRIQARRLLDLD